MSRTLRIRSPRITVLYLQGEGRYGIERPRTSLFISPPTGSVRAWSLEIYIEPIDAELSNRYKPSEHSNYLYGVELCEIRTGPNQISR